MLTIGHSNRPLPAFLELLKAHRVELLVDVRTVPRSRHNPQFNRDRLPDDLARAEISYVHMSGLGGLRRPRADSVNLGWRNSGFRGYADYMQTQEFQSNLDALVRHAAGARTAIMCAEMVPWRCHRSLIADALTIISIDVQHIITAGRAEPHRLTASARVCDDRVMYPVAVEPGRSA